MSLIGLKTEQPILLVGKPMTGKTTGAINTLGNPIIMYANEIPTDIYSLPPERGLLIEEAHYKADAKAIINIIRTYKGKIIITSNNQKDVPEEIKKKCKISRATREWGREQIVNFAPNCDNSFDVLEKSMYDIMRDFVQSNDRDKVAKILKYNKPSDNYLMIWLMNNIHINSLAFLDGHVKRKWSNNYLYELAANSISGFDYAQLQTPKKGTYSNLIKICKRVGLKPRESHLFIELLNDPDFEKRVKGKVSNAEWRKLGLGEKKLRVNKTYVKRSISTLEEW
tara:strand:- start:7257 stop:8102 length:846 start_codon:yes stop_codon:yes gene_type:complete